MITVLMATYQGKKYLEMQLDSILAQTVPVKLLISDDGSTDGTREMLEQYRDWYPKQIILKHHKNADGEKTEQEHTVFKPAVPPAAENFFWLLSQAAQNPKNEYVLLSDQDDVWENNKVEILMRRMKTLERRWGSKYPILVYSDMQVVDADLNVMNPSFFKYQHSDPERVSFPEILVENPVTGGALIMNRALLELVKKQPEACCLHDWWIALVASCFGIIDVVREPLYQYRQHGGNTVGARETGSLDDLKARLKQGDAVKENYRQMQLQARAFGRCFWKQMSRGQRRILNAFLTLPMQSPLGRFTNIRHNHFYKSSLLQTLAQCVTIPRQDEPVGRREK